MALIPDDAVDRMTELSAGAWRLYTFLARCWNHKTGQCNPSVTTTMEAIGVNRSSVYALRKELGSKSWACFNGDFATFLFGFESPKNQTSSSRNKGFSSKSPKNQTGNSAESGESKKSDPESPENQTENVEKKEITPEECQKSENSDSKEHSPEIQTKESENSDSESKNSDCHVGRTSKHEPAKGTSKGAAERTAASDHRKPRAGSGNAKKPGDKGKREPDPLFEIFCEMFAQAYDGQPYAHKTGDFVQLADLRERYLAAKTPWVITPERFMRAAKNYFATNQGQHTLADLCARFSAFFRGELDRFGKRPETVSGNGSHSAKEMLIDPNTLSPKTRGNAYALQAFIDSKRREEEK